jgi:LCP family protein required for cell wall assembly
MSFQIREIGKEKRRQKIIHRITVVSLMIVRPLLHFFKGWKKRKAQDEHSEHRILWLKRIVSIGVAFLTIAFLLIGIAFAFTSMRQSLVSLFSEAGSELPRDDNGFINVLLVGTGDDDHEGVDLTDTIIVVSIDPTTKSAVLLSVPRDLYLMKTEKMGAGRINGLYRDYKYSLIRQGIEKEEASKQAMSELEQEVSEIVNLPIHRSVKVNFSAFQEGVDAIGGIDINVPQDLVDPEYPGPNYTYITFTMPAGLQHMDGETALKYARSRHSTSDFSRSARQQQILLAAAEKVKARSLLTNISQIQEFLGILSKNVETNLSLAEMVSFAKLGETLDQHKVLTMQLNATNGIYTNFVLPGGFMYGPPQDLFQGAAVLRPLAEDLHIPEWSEIHAFAKLIFFHRDLYLLNSQIAVLNGGKSEGMARKAGGELYRYAFNIVTMENFKGSEKPTHSYIALTEPDSKLQTLHKPTAEYLSQLLSIPIEPLPGGIELTDPTDVVLVLGPDYQYKPLRGLIEQQ